MFPPFCAVDSGALVVVGGSVVSGGFSLLVLGSSSTGDSTSSGGLVITGSDTSGGSGSSGFCSVSFSFVSVLPPSALISFVLSFSFLIFSSLVGSSVGFLGGETPSC